MAPAKFLRFLSLLTLSILCLFSFSWATSHQLSLSYGLENYTWKEYHGGGKLLEESGLRHVLALGWDNMTHAGEGPLLALEGRFYFGSVDYDGATMDGDPATSTTEYFGNRYDGLLGYRKELGDFYGDLLLGGGLEMWERDIQSTTVTTSTGDTVRASGYLEEYFILYSRFAVGLAHMTPQWRFHGRMGIKYPFYTNEYVEGAQLSPGRLSSTFARITSVRVDESGRNRYAISLYYDSYRFSASKPVDVPWLDNPAYQPESDQDIWGVQVLWYF